MFYSIKSLKPKSQHLCVLSINHLQQPQNMMMTGGGQRQSVMMDQNAMNMNMNMNNNRRASMATNTQMNFQGGGAPPGGQRGSVMLNMNFNPNAMPGAMSQSQGNNNLNARRGSAFPNNMGPPMQNDDPPQGSMAPAKRGSMMVKTGAPPGPGPRPSVYMGPGMMASGMSGMSTGMMPYGGASATMGMPARKMSGVYRPGVDMRTGFDKLAGLRGVFVKQKMELLEVVVGCEMENQYNVYALSQTGDQIGHKLFKCKEKSSFLARQCLSGDCRPFEMTVYHASSADTSNEGTEFLKLVRPCACTCLCLNRPFMDVYLVEHGENVHLGKITSPCTCMNLQLDIYGDKEQILYKIEGSCCQLGLWCNWPCEACQLIHFDVKGGDGAILSGLDKKSPGCMKAMMSDADNFAVEFPLTCSLEERALLLAATLFLDFRYFEESPQQQNNPGAQSSLLIACFDTRKYQRQAKESATFVLNYRTEFCVLQQIFVFSALYSHFSFLRYICSTFHIFLGLHMQYYSSARKRSQKKWRSGQESIIQLHTYTEVAYYCPIVVYLTLRVRPRIRNVYLLIQYYFLLFYLILVW
eukprot:TRINITY_DN13092_c0_g1_i1.p1 TRINITY_DN13092_c0_g1~~TRINITY_DN13092_c0_g1_i1.p1  ORF type:complete len:581 (+),score=45.64 TRINITY_DN13092_c0_g1_i1:195-1937(+)